jgi:hypothetical protein
MPANESRKYSRIVSYIEDQVGADVNRDLLRMSLVADDLGGLTVALDEVSGQAQSAVDVANQIDQIQNILSSQTVTVTDDGSLAIATLPEPIDVSASEVDIDINSQTLGTLTVTDNGSLAVASLPEPLDVSSAEVDVDLNSQTLSPITITDDGNFSIAAWNAGTLEVNDTDKTIITDTTTSTGSASAAQLDLGDNRKDVDIHYDLSGAGTVTIEVSKNNSDWRAFSSESPTSAEADVLQIDTSYRYVRVYADQNLNLIELSSKGE